MKKTITSMMLVLSAILMTATTAKAQTEHQTERDKISSVVMNLMNEWDHTAFQNATALIAQVANYDMNYLTAEGVMRLLGMKTAIEGTPDYRLLFSGNLFTGHFTVQNGAWVKESDANDLQLSYNAPNGVPCVLKMTTGGGVKTTDLPLEEDQLETLKDLVKSLTDKVGNDEGGSQSSAVTEAAMLLLKTYMDGVKMMTFEIPAQTSIELTYGGKQMMTSIIDVDLNSVGATVYDGLLMSANTKFYKGVLDNHGTGYFELNLVNSGYKPGTGINLDFTIGNDTKKCITVKANAPGTFKGFSFYQSNMSRRNEEMPFDIGFESLNVEVDVMGQAQLKGNVSNLNALILAMAAADDSDMESVKAGLELANQLINVNLYFDGINVPVAKMQLLPSYNEEYKEWEAKPNIVFASDGKAYPIKEFFTAENFPEVALAVKTITDEINTLVDVARGKAEEAIVGVQTANSTLQTGTTEWYTLDGKRTSSTAKGIKIMRMSDGTVKKVVTR